MTRPINLLAPCPAISLPLPVGDGMPVGLQLVGHPYRDNRLVSLARDLERALAG